MMTDFKSNQSISRRHLLAASTGVLAFPAMPPLLGQTTGERPHFFLQILLRDGMDNLYLTDARPQAFTAAGLVPNYMPGDANIWLDRDGHRCLTSPLADAALRPFKKRLAIVNGVHMPPGFDGHDQNINSLLTNNPFGGTYIGHKLPSAPYPFERVALGSFEGVTVTSSEQTLSIDPLTARALNTQIKELQNKSGNTAFLKPWQQRLQKRAARCGQGTSLLAGGCQSYASALATARALVPILAGARPRLEGLSSQLEQTVHTALTYFKSGLTRSSLVSTRDYAFDAHAIGDAQASYAVFNTFLGDLTSVFRMLETTAYDAAAGLSMLDVTTVMVASEFGRTFGQSGRPVDETGTDHNTLANSVLLLGKGIRGDQIVGSTDLDTLDASGGFAPVSNAHLEVDAKLLKKMGRAFDFAKQSSSSASPQRYESDDYITSATVTNTILSAFSVDRSAWLTNGPGEGAPARILSRVLA